MLCDAQCDYDGHSEADRLRQWALAASPGDYILVGVKGFGLSGFQYLRMLSGAQTSKPDVHIRRFVSKVIGRRVSDHVALALLERAAKRAGLPLRAVDGAMWEQHLRNEQTA